MAPPRRRLTPEERAAAEAALDRMSKDEILGLAAKARRKRKYHATYMRRRRKLERLARERDRGRAEREARVVQKLASRADQVPPGAETLEAVEARSAAGGAPPPDQAPDGSRRTEAADQGKPAVEQRDGFEVDEDGLVVPELGLDEPAPLERLPLPDLPMPEIKVPAPPAVPTPPDLPPSAASVRRDPVAAPEVPTKLRGGAPPAGMRRAGDLEPEDDQGWLDDY